MPEEQREEGGSSPPVTPEELVSQLLLIQSLPGVTSSLRAAGLPTCSCLQHIAFYFQEPSTEGEGVLPLVPYSPGSSTQSYYETEIPVSILVYLLKP